MNTKGDGQQHGRHRARRGALVHAVLTMLDERPMHGYELINELDARSGGRWRPSAGAMYPALARMEAHGLVEAEQVDDKKQFTLTDHGRERLAQVRTQRSGDAPEPWDDHGIGERGQLRRHVAELVGQARQIGRFGSHEQIDAAVEVLRSATRDLYGILAAPADSAEQSDAAEQRADVDDRAAD